MAHFSEVPMVFHSTPMLLTSEELVLSNNMISYWTNFARVGNPGAGLPGVVWPRFNNQNRSYLDLDLQIYPGIDLRALQCDLWDEVFRLKCQISKCPCICNVNQDNDNPFT